MKEEIIALKEVSFEADNRVIIDQVSFSVDVGEFITLTGPSGSGKSTLLKLIGQLINPTSGTIEYDGKNIFDYEPTEYRKEISYFFQNAALFDETVSDNLAFPATIRGEAFDEQRAVQGLEAVQLPGAYLTKPINELSGGEKQRVALVRNLMYQPRVLLMDEVTSSLDAENQAAILSFVHQLNQEDQVTVLWVTHNPAEIEAADKVLRIVEGKLEEIRDGE